MISPTDHSGSAKRPWPFDSYETLERTPAFTPSFNSVASVHHRQHDGADRRSWMQDFSDSSSLRAGLAVLDQNLEEWNQEAANLVQNDDFFYQTVEADIQHNHTAIETSYPTWNAFQPANITGYAFSEQSPETPFQNNWNAPITSHGWSSPEHLSLAHGYAAAEARAWTASGEGRPALDAEFSTFTAQDLTPCNAPVAPRVTVAVGQVSSCLEFAGNFWPTPSTQVGDASWVGTPQTAPEGPVQDLGRAASTSIDSNGSIACFGTICDVSVRLLDKPLNLGKLDAFSPDSDNQDFRKFSIVERDQYYALHCGQDVDIGVIDARTTKTLRRLDEVDSVTYEAVADAGDLDQCVRTWKNKGRVADWNVEINIYGHRKAADKVSELLSAARLCLQQPRWLTGKLSVENPHEIRFPNLTILSESAHLPASLSTPDCSSATTTRDLTEVLEDLDQDEHLGLVDVDSRIASTLHDHQRRGVDFLLQREAAISSSVFALWEGVQTGGFNATYRHKVTGKRLSKPLDDVSGGILADEMGLGKTLMMLSTILATMNQSRAFYESYGATGSSEKQRSGATLVIVPSALLIDSWMEEISNHVGSDTLRVQKHHGNRKKHEIAKLVDAEIVLTTYATIAAEFSRDSRLHGITWFRIVLDEAHMIRNQSTKCFRAVASLSAKIRWCLTGTPIQNRLDDLGALVRFLRVPLLDTPSAFRKHFVQPIEAGSDIGFQNLRTLLKCICIRRTRDLLRLPKVQNVDHSLLLSPAEQLRYAQIGESYRQAIDDAVCGRKPSEAYRTIFQALLKLRMLCNHGTLQPNDGTSPTDEAGGCLELLKECSESCAYCSADVAPDWGEEDPMACQLPGCSHAICGECRERYQEHQRLNEDFEAACPICKAAPNDGLVSGKRAIPRDFLISLSEDGVSTKLSKLLEDVKEHRFSDKCIIFSSWKRTLYIISLLLSKQGVSFVQLDGSLSLSARRQVLSTFQRDPQASVLLMTLGTGAVGLNLTVATRIHIVEPQWNPSVESQALSRAVRIGQEKQVTIIRYVVLNTVEQYIQSRQSRKLQIAELGFDMGSDEDSKDVKLKKIMDLRVLLGM